MQVPRAGWSSSIRPPCAATMPRAMDSPRPEPELAARRRRRIGSNGACATSGGSPGPSSATMTSTAPGPSGAALTVTRVPAGLWLVALFSRFTKTCSSRS